MERSIQKYLWSPRCWLCMSEKAIYWDLCWQCSRTLVNCSKSSSGLFSFHPISSRLVRKSRSTARFRAGQLFWQVAKRKGYLEKWKKMGIENIYWLPQGKTELSGLEIFARRVGEAIGSPANGGFRKILSKAQHTKSRSHRMDEDLIFEFTGGKAPSWVLLLDDVQSTGTSLEQGKYLLKKAGAKRVETFPLVVNVMNGFERERGQTQEESQEMNPFLLQLFV